MYKCYNIDKKWGVGGERPGVTHRWVVGHATHIWAAQATSDCRGRGRAPQPRAHLGEGRLLRAHDRARRQLARLGRARRALLRRGLRVEGRAQVRRRFLPQAGNARPRMINDYPK